MKPWSPRSIFPEEQMAWRQTVGQSLSIPVLVRLKSLQQGEGKWQVGNLAYLVP